jgi:GDPmannose 4,6-dehydratase
VARKRAIVLGAAGQDGSFLCDLLLARGFEVHGVVRRTSSTPDNLWRVAHLQGKITVHEGDVLDASSIGRVVSEVRPSWVLNCADQDSVGYSKKTIGYSLDITCGAVGRMLELVRQIDPTIRWFQPLSSTMFGDCPQPPQDEDTPLDPRSPYACAKAAAFHICRYFRRAHGMFVACGIFHGHDSVRRAPGYLLQKVARGAAAIAKGEQKTLALGNLSLRVDIGHAPEFMEVACRMMELPDPDDFVIATGRARSLAEVALAAFEEAAVLWGGGGLGGLVTKDPEFYRPGPQPLVVGDAAKAADVLGWKAASDAVDVVRLLARHFLGVSS